MTILALEFSSGQRSVAVANGNSVLSEAVETGGRNTAAFGMIERVLAEAKIEREQIDAIAVGLGPGSYTGIRSAIAIAQGWQLARKIKLLGVSSAEAIAAQAQSEKIFGDVNVVVDAQRGEIYLARYEISEEAVKEIGPLRIANPLDCGDMSPLSKRGHVRALQNIFIGPEATKWFPAGKVIFPRAAAVARLAAGRSDFISSEKLEPIYLRETSFVKAVRPKTAI
ncbi:MAG TPA: tRNA (adenosine(37)-N6)-threonylcarbamoyltransferase complex dimerization subunit type 1 TsaB [Methylomirabilota bacterium]|nr:tRNA (adenosine(37)-N6)-threonylcarbamoyltransferase complex dimerization subunit type 1 TsaB [Methylomirabilota bacterium]